MIAPGRSYRYIYSYPPGPTSAISGLPTAGCGDLVGSFDYPVKPGTNAFRPDALDLPANTFADSPK